VLNSSCVRVKRNKLNLHPVKQDQDVEVQSVKYCQLDLQCMWHKFWHSKRSLGRNCDAWTRL